MGNTHRFSIYLHWMIKLAEYKFYSTSEETSSETEESDDEETNQAVCCVCLQPRVSFSTLVDMLNAVKAVVTKL